MKRVIIKKIKDLGCSPDPHRKDEGYERIAFLTNQKPEVGKEFWIPTSKFETTWLKTSTVTEIINENTFKTRNSIYQILEDNEVMAD